ncbi:hypothetical protein SUGI_1463420 [Cryptomeria japonica]|uniref:Uncharacterized protein n=1 Tax=Cryptomeria japonica TaxID=3369 RepID=A0AAD3NRN5_CRYJA|nr:hypothetical protein SUGI_1450020 [Cryptomeria japonica]GLJ58607.1 hypothetical protein SUGI_1463420 [Cryptomeria japonica]
MSRPLAIDAAVPYPYYSKGNTGPFVLSSIAKKGTGMKKNHSAVGVTSGVTQPVGWAGRRGDWWSDPTGPFHSIPYWNAVQATFIIYIT